MKGCSTAAVEVSGSNVTLLDQVRSKCTQASSQSRSCKSNIYEVSSVFQAKLKAQKADDPKRFNWNLTSTQVSELFSKTDSFFSEQQKGKMLTVGRGGSRTQPFGSWTGQDALDGMVTRNSKTVTDMSVDVSRNREQIVQPPRLCTLREFREGEGVMIKADRDDGSSFLRTLAANAEALVQAKNFELLSGRFAMVAFAFALGMEYVTGNSVFKGIDFQRLGELAILCAVAATSAGIFAIGWGTKAQISVFMSRGYQNLVDSTLDRIVDGLFYDDS